MTEVTETGARERIARKTYVRATGNPEPNFDRFLAKYRSAPGWKTYEIPCGHDAMIDMPERLTDILIDAA